MTFFDQKIWKQKFISNKFDTAWRCGQCGIGSLKLEKSITTKDPTCAVNVICTDFHCRKRYSMLATVAHMAGTVNVSSNFLKVDDIRLYPTQFQPELIMFGLPILMNQEIKRQIVQSFNHFWYDFDACANKIRQAVELIMVERGAIGKSLHQKITSLQPSLGAKLTSSLLALKWVGNDGSHASKQFERDNLLDVYGLLVDVLNTLYPDESEKERRENLVAIINANNGLKTK